MKNFLDLPETIEPQKCINCVNYKTTKCVGCVLNPSLVNNFVGHKENISMQWFVDSNFSNPNRPMIDIEFDPGQIGAIQIIGKLDRILKSEGNDRYYATDDTEFGYYDTAQVREDWWFIHDGSPASPLPPGFMFDVWYEDGDIINGVTSQEPWTHVKAYRVTGVLETHKYPWQKTNE